MPEKQIFNPEDTNSEVERLLRPPSTINWTPFEGIGFELTIPSTVYPPREDTNLLARRLITMGPGRGRRLLEIGCGSGALSVLAASMGWKINACDINPFAVAATRGNLDFNQQKGIVKEGGIGPELFPFDTNYDLIIWNLPYVPVSEVDQVLGPMEEAGLIDSDEQGLGNRMIRSIVSNQLLAPNGIILVLGREDSIQNTQHLAHRVWDEMIFDDGEKLVITCLWRPFENSEKYYVERTGSTNDDLMEKSGIGTHISSSWQEAGRGRRKRTWSSIEGCYAGSWIVAEGGEINPGHLQLSGGLAVINSINNDNLKLKWPNDILIGNRKMCGVLAEGKTNLKGTKVILGIGVNLQSGDNDVEVEIAALDEIVKLTHQEFDLRLNCELASLLEQGPKLPPIRYDEIRNQIIEHMKSYGKPSHKGIVYDSFELNQRGELILGELIIDDGEDVDWI